MITHLWHTILDMPKKSKKWHLGDIKDEMEEYTEASGLFDLWSEVSDVVYTYTRAKWSGHKKIKWPLGFWHYAVGWLYMIPKYSLRWMFYYWVGKKLMAKKKVTEVRNYKKEEKLRHIAKKYNIPEDLFIKEVKRLSRFWIFLP